MSIYAAGLIELSSPPRNVEGEKEEEISVIETVQEAVEPIFPGVGEEGAPVSVRRDQIGSSELPPSNTIVSIIPHIDLEDIQEIESQSKGRIYSRMLRDIQSNQTNERYRNNGITTIRAFEAFRTARQEFENGNPGSYRALVQFFHDHSLGFHEESYWDSNKKFSPEMFMASGEAIEQMLLDAYDHAEKNSLLPIFFQLALSDGGCFQARSNKIMEYQALLDKPDGKKDMLKALVGIYSHRYGAGQLPVNLDKFVEFVKTQTSLSLEDFGVDSENLAEDPIIQELTSRGLFPSEKLNVDLEVLCLFSEWSIENTGRRSFREYILDQIRNNLTGSQKTAKGLDQLIDKLIKMHPDYDFSIFNVEKIVIKKEPKQPVAEPIDVSIGDFFETSEE